MSARSRLCHCFPSLLFLFLAGSIALSGIPEHCGTRWNSRCKTLLYSRLTALPHSVWAAHSAILRFSELPAPTSLEMASDTTRSGLSSARLPPLQRAATSQRAPGLLTNWLQTGGSPGPLFRFGNLLEHSELRETLYLLLPVRYKGYN